MLDINPDIKEYCAEHSSNIPAFHSEILRSTFKKSPMSVMASDEIQGRLLQLLTGLTQGQLVIEVGTFTAYATTFLAQGIKPGGKVITIEKNQDLRGLIEQHLSQTNLESKIEVRYGDALQILSEIKGPIDLVFIDAGKREYIDYFNLVIEKMRDGGLILADNTLWKGLVLEDKKDKMTSYLHEFNQIIAQDDRLEVLLLPYRDGLTIMRKK